MVQHWHCRRAACGAAAAAADAAATLLPRCCRTDYEIGSGAVLVRSTPFGYCFLEEWIRRGTGVQLLVVQPLVLDGDSRGASGHELRLILGCSVGDHPAQLGQWGPD